MGLADPLHCVFMTQRSSLATHSVEKAETSPVRLKLESPNGL
ncbi:MAG: hypothetical protein WCI18_05795 [Pseudomonadota bacterium]